MAEANAMTPAPPMSEAGKLVGVFVEPPAAFRAIVGRPQSWWIPVVLLTVFSVIFIGAFSSRVGWERMMRQAMEHSSRAKEMTPDQIEKASETGAKMGGVIGFVGAVVGTVAVIAVVGGFYMLLFNGLLSAGVSYLQSMAIVGYAWLPHLVYQLMALAVMYLKSPDDFDLRSPLPLDLGILTNPDTTPKWLTALASSIDLFSFWTLVLIAVGYAAASKKVKFPAALMTAAAGWVLYVLIKTGWAAVTG